MAFLKSRRLAFLRAEPLSVLIVIFLAFTAIGLIIKSVERLNRDLQTVAALDFTEKCQDNGNNEIGPPLFFKILRQLDVSLEDSRTFTKGDLSPQF